MPLTDEQKAAAEQEERLAGTMRRYRRHEKRIARLERVLDPEDEGAVALTGNENSLQAEINRRQAEMEALAARITQNLAEQAEEDS